MLRQVLPGRDEGLSQRSQFVKTNQALFGNEMSPSQPAKKVLEPRNNLRALEIIQFKNPGIQAGDRGLQSQINTNFVC